MGKGENVGKQHEYLPNQQILAKKSLLVKEYLLGVTCTCLSAEKCIKVGLVVFGFPLPHNDTC